MVDRGKIFAVYESGSTSLPELCGRLLDAQRAAWPELDAGCRGLKSARQREVLCGDFTVRLQFNPRRMASTGAKVDRESIRKRPCFLCLENLPRGQKGVLYGGTYLILCNPAPIFPGHYTVSSLRHEPQEIARSLPALLSLARDLAGFTVFYNGPRCGASAPDHLHFQAVPSGSIPLEGFEQNGVRAKVSGVAVSALEKCGRAAVVLEGGDAGGMESAFLRLIEEAKKAVAEPPGEPDEPMMNLLCSHGREGWRITVFLRRKHRPDAFYREGEAQIMVSPAAVDLGGVVITPREKDFEALGPESLRDIFREVSLDGGTLDRVLSGLR